MNSIKKIIICIAVLVGLGNMLIGCTSIQFINDEEVTYKYEEVKEKLIRFHVLANSDSEEDQSVKLKVRDAVLKYLYPKLEKSKSLQESRSILKSEDKKVLDIARKVIKDEGYSYKVKSEFGKNNFPVKTYGNITLPQGEYESYRLLIGEAKGANWWCVMFPPLCFVDITKGEVSYDETKDIMDQWIYEGETEFSFKIYEVIEDLF